MKNTRISRLKRNKKFKQATKLLTAGLLVCPLAIGTIKALADEAETTPPMEQLEETPATAEETVPVEETETSEPVQPEVIEESQPVIEQLTDSVAEAQVLQEQSPASENMQEVGITPLSDSNVVAEYRAKLASYQQQANDLVTAGATASQMESINLMLTEMDKMIGYYESDFGQVPTQWLVEIDYSLIPALEAEIQKVKDELNPVETVNYTIKCVDQNGFTIYETTKSAKKGTSVTETAPEVEFHMIFGESTQTKTIGDNTVFAFVYERLEPTGLFYDVIGDTTAKVGETKTYQYNEVRFYSNGTMTETVVNVEDTNYPLTSSDPSDVIVNGTITFGSEGTRTLSASNAGISLEVTVAKDDVTPPTIVDIELNISGATSAKVGESKTYQLEKIEYFSDGTKKITMLDFPNEYGALISSDSIDVIKDGAITYGYAGTRTLKSESYGEASFTVTVTEDGINPPVTDVDTTKLESSIKDAEAKLTAGGYTAQSMNALKQALQNAKDVLANANSTQAEIDEAQKALDLAIANLVKEDNSNGGNTGNNGSNGTGNSSNNPNTSSNGTNNTNNQTSNKQNSTTTTTKPAGNNTSKDGLPQTGEQSATNTVITGLSLTMLSILAWFKKKKV